MTTRQPFGWKVPPKEEATLSNNEIKELIEEAPRIVADAIRRGWIKPPKFRLTDAQIDSSLKR